MFFEFQPYLLKAATFDSIGSNSAFRSLDFCTGGARLPWRAGASLWQLELTAHQTSGRDRCSVTGIHRGRPHNS